MEIEDNEYEAIRRDAMRYRWLRDSDDYDTLTTVFEFTPATSWDSTIDDAIAARSAQATAGATDATAGADQQQAGGE